MGTGVTGQGLDCFQFGKTRFLFGAQLFRFFRGAPRFEKWRNGKMEKLLALRLYSSKKCSKFSLSPASHYRLVT